MAAAQSVTPNSALTIESLVKTFAANGKRALDGVSLEVRTGEILGLLGPNGAGKSTLVRSIMGRVRPDSGTIRIFGQAAGPGETAPRNAVGYIPQDLALYGSLTCSENLETFARYQGMSAGDSKKAAAWGLKWAALEDRAGDRADHLSGGMKRRLNMAAGMVHRPKLVLFDEPTVGVDPQSRERIYGMIEELRAEGATVIYTTHYMEEAERLCDRIAVIDHGKLIALGTRQELVDKTLGGGRSVFVDCDSEPQGDVLQQLLMLGASVEGTHVRLTARDITTKIPELLNVLKQNGGIRDMVVKQPTLEQVFLHLTGRELRD